MAFQHMRDRLFLHQGARERSSVLVGYGTVQSLCRGLYFVRPVRFSRTSLIIRSDFYSLEAAFPCLLGKYDEDTPRDAQSRPMIAFLKLPPIWSKTSKAVV